MPAQWTELPTAAVTVCCDPPFSFYFDLVETVWKRDAPTNNAPLHRLCTLARKQGVNYLVIESAMDRAEVRAEVDGLDDARGGGGSADAVSISFFRADEAPHDIKSVEPSSLLGQAVVINYRDPGSSKFTDTYIYEAIMPPPSIPGRPSTKLLNNYISIEGSFSRIVKGRVFLLDGVYYCQQNSCTHVCAHACLRMGLNSLGPQTEISAGEINSHLGLTPPLAGLQLTQLVEIIEKKGNACSPIINCSLLQNSQMFVSALAAYVESGFLCLLVFTTSQADEHVVTVFGYTRNSDQWHPQAMRAYGGPSSAPYYTASSWVSGFLVHDDNFGPYYTLSARALDADPTVKAHWIIPITPISPAIQPFIAETIAAISLSNNLSGLAHLSKGRWFDYLTRPYTSQVLRTLLVTKESYLRHLKDSVAHDASRASDAELASFDKLPDIFWMVEFSLPALFTGNRSKLGEVLVRCDFVTGDSLSDIARDTNRAVHAIRLPNMILLNTPSFVYQKLTSTITAHVPIYEVQAHTHVW